LLRALLAALVLTPASAWALRSNLRGDLDRLEQMGHFDEVLFHRRSTMDMVLAIHVAWSGAAYDPAMDSVYFETRTDRRFWNIVHGQKRAITDLLAKARLTPDQLARTDERVRVYVEDHLSPEFDEMGNFYFRRRAWILERLGMFYDAHFRRRLTGHYCLRVCQPYYATMAAELERGGRQSLAAAYRAKAAAFERQAGQELRRSNGDRLMAERQGGRVAAPMGRADLVGFLQSALNSAHADARLAAVLNLLDLGELATVARAANDPDIEIRRVLACAFTDARFTAGLAAMASDSDPQVRLAIDGGSWARPLLQSGLSPGIRATYFTDPDQKEPVAAKVLACAEMGLNGNERFAPGLKPYWESASVFPPNASGQFLVRLDGRIRIPADSHYRFYIKTDGGRATVRLNGATIVSPANDRLRLYAVQAGPGGESANRMDFSLPVALNRGLANLSVEYRGPEARTKQGFAGLRLCWSADDFVMEPVPSAVLFHDPR
jgi:hypothetical protein